MTHPHKKTPKPPARVVTTDADIDAAIARGNTRDTPRLQIVQATYLAADDLVALTLATGIEVRIPRRLLQGLQEASPEDLAQIDIEGPGTGLHWPTLDVDHYAPALLNEVFGTRQWMAELGQKGGQATSDAKAAAARANGRRGGRPRKQPSPRAA